MDGGVPVGFSGTPNWAILVRQYYQQLSNQHPQGDTPLVGNDAVDDDHILSRKILQNDRHIAHIAMMILNYNEDK
uniref:DUF1800 family protein n=1 Tax=Angiostrongylus cantonensis TaxID=6313 RepID=A0A0K0CWJ2_ANGCA